MPSIQAGKTLQKSQGDHHSYMVLVDILQHSSRYRKIHWQLFGILVAFCYRCYCVPYLAIILYVDLLLADRMETLDIQTASFNRNRAKKKEKEHKYHTDVSPPNVGLFCLPCAICMDCVTRALLYQQS